MIVTKLKGETDSEYFDRIKKYQGAFGIQSKPLFAAKKGEARGFCPTGEGGGIKNDCGPGSAPSYGRVRSDDKKRVASNLEKVGVSQDKAISVTGAKPNDYVWVRPAPESGPNSVMIGAASDIAGIKEGFEVTSIIKTDGDKKVVEHMLFDVLPEVTETSRGRMAAATAFYKTMAASIEASKAAGFDEIRFSASGDDGHPLKGYTIWPRMGFDAPIPSDIELPDEFQDAKTLLDLHATPEGTRFWAEKGHEVDLKVDLKDTKSRQAKAISEFISKMKRNKRSFEELLAETASLLGSKYRRTSHG